MRAIRQLEWRAILAGVGTVFLASIVFAAIPILMIMAVPTPEWFQDLFIWLSDTEGGRVISAFAYLAAGSAVTYRVASQRRALHGCLVPIVAIGGLWLVAGIVVVLWAVLA